MTNEVDNALGAGARAAMPEEVTSSMDEHADARERTATAEEKIGDMVDGWLGEPKEHSAPESEDPPEPSLEDRIAAKLFPETPAQKPQTQSEPAPGSGETPNANLLNANILNVNDTLLIAHLTAQETALQAEIGQYKQDVLRMRQIQDPRQRSAVALALQQTEMRLRGRYAELNRVGEAIERDVQGRFAAHTAQHEAQQQAQVLKECPDFDEARYADYLKRLGVPESRIKAEKNAIPRILVWKALRSDEQQRQPKQIKRALRGPVPPQLNTPQANYRRELSKTKDPRQRQKLAEARVAEIFGDRR